jgi:hypothetical protein
MLYWTEGLFFEAIACRDCENTSMFICFWSDTRERYLNGTLGLAGAPEALYDA